MVTQEVAPAWYCLLSQPRHEQIAVAHLRKLEGLTVFCPRIRLQKATRQGLVWITEPIFPGYLFAHFEFAGMHRHVRHAHGVKGILQFGERYPTIPPETIAQLRECAGEEGVKDVPYTVSAGDQVTVVEGVFVGLEAVVTQVLPAKQRVRILMDFLGRKTEAEVKYASVVPEVAHPLAA